MRGSGGRTISRGSLRGHPKGEAGKRRQKTLRGCGAAATSRSGSHFPGAEPDRRPSSPSLRNRRDQAAMGAALACGTSFEKKSSAGAKKHKRLEVFVPLQRHLYGDERLYLPCPGGAR